MWRWLRDRIDDLREAFADALDALRERLFGRGEEQEEELIDEAEAEEIEEIEEIDEQIEEIAGEVGDEYIIDLIEEIEEEEERHEQQEEQEEQEEQEQQEQEERQEEAATQDDVQIIYELFEDAAETLAQNEHLLTNAELERAETLLEEAAVLMEELRGLDDDDRTAAVDLILEALADVEAIVARAEERGEDGDCEEARGPFVSYEDAVAYARSIPCPAWVYVDGIGWWWVCLDDCSP